MCITTGRTGEPYGVGQRSQRACRYVTSGDENGLGWTEEEWLVYPDRWCIHIKSVNTPVNLWRSREFSSPLGLSDRQTDTSGHKPQRLLRLERRLRIKYTTLQQPWVILCLTSERKNHRGELSLCMCASVNLMRVYCTRGDLNGGPGSHSLSSPFLLTSYFFSALFSVLFCAAVPSPAMHHTADKSLWHVWHSAEQ